MQECRVHILQHFLIRWTMEVHMCLVEGLQDAKALQAKLAGIDGGKSQLIVLSVYLVGWLVCLLSDHLSFGHSAHLVLPVCPISFILSVLSCLSVRLFICLPVYLSVKMSIFSFLFAFSFCLAMSSPLLFVCIFLFCLVLSCIFSDLPCPLAYLCCLVMICCLSVIYPHE